MSDLSGGKRPGVGGTRPRRARVASDLGTGFRRLRMRLEAQRHKLSRAGTQWSRLARGRRGVAVEIVSCDLAIRVALDPLYGRAADGLHDDRQLSQFGAQGSASRAFSTTFAANTFARSLISGLSLAEILKTVNASVHQASPVEASSRLHGCFPMAVGLIRNPSVLRIFPCRTGIPRERPATPTGTKFLSLRVLRWRCALAPSAPRFGSVLSGHSRQTRRNGAPPQRWRAK